MSDQLLEGALGLAAWGVPVISLRSRAKIPVHRNWPALGMLDPDSIRIEWELNPGSNIGVLCGSDAFGGRGLVVIDVDVPDGMEALRELELQHGSLTATATVRTPSGGRHFYYTGHAISWNPTPGLEVRSTGRQCAAPPSAVENRPYRWVAERELAEIPMWLQVPVNMPQREPRGRLTPSGDRDPVLRIDPPAYFRALTGLVPDRQGFVSCPVHPHPDVEPSCKVYDTADRGWFCYGAACQKGGDIVTLAALLAGIDTPVTGYRFIQTLDWLRGRFS